MVFVFSGQCRSSLSALFTGSRDAFRTWGVFSHSESVFDNSTDYVRNTFNDELLIVFNDSTTA